MARMLYGVALVWLSGCLLLAGCATSSSHKNAADTGYFRDENPEDVNERLVEAHAHYAQALIYDMDEQPDLALEEYGKAALDDPSNEDLVLELTRRYLQQKNPDKALELLTKAAAEPEASGAVFANLGLVYSRMGKDKEAIDAVQTAIKRSPQSLSGYQNLFIIYLQKGQSKEALKVLDQAAKAPEVTGQFLVDLASLYTQLIREAPSLKLTATGSGLAVLNRAVKLSPNAGPRTTLKLADNYSELGDTKTASELYHQLLTKYADMPALADDIHAKLAEIYLRNHDAAKAKEQLEALVRDDPSNPQAYYFLGAVATDEKKLPEAEQYYEKALLLNEDFEQAYYDLAGVQINLDKPKDALATLQKARSKFTRNFTTEFLSALAYTKAKDYTNAVSHFTSAELIARATEPTRLDAYFYFEAGAAYERKGDFDQAEQLFVKCLQLSPDLPEALNYYGYMLADKGIKLQKAREMIEKAVQQEPKNAAYIDSLGWVLFRLGKNEEGLAQIQKAIQLTEEPDATLYEHLGDIYAALKQTDKAREAWRKSLSIEPNEQIQKKLDKSGDKSSM